MLRFTTRDLLWLMVVAAMWAVLVAERNRLERERGALRQEQAALAAKRAELEFNFLRSVEITDRLHVQMQAAGASNR